MPYKEPQRAREYRKKHYLKNKEAYLERSKDRRLAGKNADYMAEYRHRPYVKDKKAQWWQDREPWLKRIQYLKRRCRTRSSYSGIEARITPEELKEVWDRDNADSLMRPCIHRIDSGGHYERENVEFMEFEEHARLHSGR